MARKTKKSEKAFDERAFARELEHIREEIRELYLSEERPWIIGYSGGKDSTAVLQLVWTSVRALAPDERTNPIYVISTDTLVENPVVSIWVKQSHATMRSVAQQEEMPVLPNLLYPEITDSFWVKLIGKGYPYPRPKFRWCTERLKINPSSKFIRSIVRERGDAILVLGMRKAESSLRAKSMREHEKNRVRDRLSPNASLPGTHVYTPIEDWDNEDVWYYLLEEENTPWGFDNQDLFAMYKGASSDNECPLVVETGTPSCGSSRFGCWTCTLVDKDRSMQAMIQNDDEKEWMLPLLELRDYIRVDDRSRRDFRRMSGVVQIFKDRPIPGPYRQKWREDFLARLLRAQQKVRNMGPSFARELELIRLEELEEIRRIWVVEKHEFEDSLPRIYSQATGRQYPGGHIDDSFTLGGDVIDKLREACGQDELLFELTRELIDIESRFRMMARRSGLFVALEKAFQRNKYIDETDALERGLRLQKAKEDALSGKYKQMSLLNGLPERK